MPLPALLRCTSQVPVKVPPCGFVIPDVDIDRLVADGKRPVFPKLTCDLIRTPSLLQEPVHDPKVVGAEIAIPSRARSPGPGSVRRDEGAISTIPSRSVATKLPRDRAPVSPQGSRGLRLVEALPSQGREHVSFFRGDLVIRHQRFPLLGRLRNRGVFQVTSFSGSFVALTL